MSQRLPVQPQNGSDTSQTFQVSASIHLPFRGSGARGPWPRGRGAHRLALQNRAAARNLPLTVNEADLTEVPR